jgi:hypothetical protein
MLEDNQPPWDPGNQCGEDYELGCIMPGVSLDHANQTVLFPDQLSLADQLILHALGVAWRAQTVPPLRRRLRKTNLAWVCCDENTWP